MKIHYSLEEVRGVKNPVVTTGSFDGVHVGHKVILRRLKKLARDINGETVLITFHPHPRRVLYPGTAGKDLLMINTQREKIWLLEKTGLDHLVIVHFTPEFSRVTSHEFVEKYLVGALNVHTVVVGFNHHFGFQRKGDFEYLYSLGHTHSFEVEEIPEQDIQNESVSSTKIRQAILQGNIQRANAYLDHYYIIRSKLLTEADRLNCNGISFYHTPVEEDIKLVPPDGIYAVNVEADNFFGKGMVVISGWGIKDSRLSDEIYIGLHILEDHMNIKGKDVTLYFHKQIRGKGKGKVETELLSDNLIRKDILKISELIY